MKKTTKTTTAAKKKKKLSQTKAARDARTRRRRQKLARVTLNRKTRKRAKLAGLLAGKALKFGKLVQGMSPAALTREATIVIADGRGEMPPYVSISDNFGEINVTQRCERIRVLVLLKGRSYRYDVTRPRR